MEKTEIIIITLVILAALILQIVLFCKIWAMTNDVREIRNNFVLLGSDFDFEIRKLLALGNKEKAKELILNDFFDIIKNLNYSGLDRNDEDDKEAIQSIDRRFEEVKKELEFSLKKIGVELPENIKILKSGNDFYNLF
jgi:biopolymer transport protein ExbB/TolQ